MNSQIELLNPEKRMEYWSKIEKLVHALLSLKNNARGGFQIFDTRIRHVFDMQQEEETNLLRLQTELQTCQEEIRKLTERSSVLHKQIDGLREQKDLNMNRIQDWAYKKEMFDTCLKETNRYIKEMQTIRARLELEEEDTQDPPSLRYVDETSTFILQKQLWMKSVQMAEERVRNSPSTVHPAGEGRGIEKPANTVAVSSLRDGPGLATKNNASQGMLATDDASVSSSSSSGSGMPTHPTAERRTETMPFASSSSAHPNAHPTSYASTAASSLSALQVATTVNTQPSSSSNICVMVPQNDCKVPSINRSSTTTPPISNQVKRGPEVATAEEVGSSASSTSGSPVVPIRLDLFTKPVNGQPSSVSPTTPARTSSRNQEQLLPNGFPRQAAHGSSDVVSARSLTIGDPPTTATLPSSVSGLAASVNVEPARPGGSTVTSTSSKAAASVQIPPIVREKFRMFERLEGFDEVNIRRLDRLHRNDNRMDRRILNKLMHIREQLPNNPYFRDIEFSNLTKWFFKASPTHATSPWVVIVREDGQVYHTKAEIAELLSFFRAFATCLKCTDRTLDENPRNDHSVMICENHSRACESEIHRSCWQAAHPNEQEPRKWFCEQCIKRRKIQ